jgi:hypothetical protein
MTGIEDFAPFNVNVTTQDPGSEDPRNCGSGDTRWGIRVAFTSNLNLLTGRAITIQGVDDAVVDGAQSYAVTLSTNSADLSFHQLQASPAAVHNLDDHVAASL